MNEYTATIAYELLKEGEEGRQKVDAVKMILRAEGILQMKNMFCLVLCLLWVYLDWQLNSSHKQQAIDKKYVTSTI